MLLGFAFIAAIGDKPASALSADDRAALVRELDEGIGRLTRQLKTSPDSPDLFRERGTLLLERGDFPRAVADFDALIRLAPDADASCWQRGIALYFAGRYADGAAQFDRYHSFDQVDRENGLWRFLCQAKSSGVEKARREMLRYQREDRPPLGDVYLLFADRITPDELLARVDKGAVNNLAGRLPAEFYADLYLGFYFSVNGQTKDAEARLRRATINKWGRAAKGGPGVMWHVARLEHERTLEKLKRDEHPSGD